jgi:triosephosphate isomerase
MKKFCYGNWKLNLPHQNFFDNNAEWEELSPSVELAVFAQATHLTLVSKKINTRLKVGAQDISAHKSGAYTGEISSAALHELGIKKCLVGHSERRLYHGETSINCNTKIKECLAKNIQPVYCIGETLEQKENNETALVLTTQIKEGLKDISGEIVLAYEPVWAIGTGKVATPEDIVQSVSIILDAVPETVKVHLLYGGSVKPENIDEIMNVSGVKGALIGGASLDPESFFELARAMEKYVQ